MSQLWLTVGLDQVLSTTQHGKKKTSFWLVVFKPIEKMIVKTKNNISQLGWNIKICFQPPIKQPTHEPRNRQTWSAFLRQVVGRFTVPCSATLLKLRHILTKVTGCCSILGWSWASVTSCGSIILILSYLNIVNISIYIYITYLPHEAVAEVSKDKEPIGRGCAEFNWFESQLMSDSNELRFK